MSKTVLIADDSFFMRITLKNLLTSGGYHVISEAKDGYEAIVYYERHKPDIVILDIIMPKTDGIEALKMIKQKNKQANVIICSSLSQPSVILDALKNGASKFVPKQEFRNIINILATME